MFFDPMYFLFIAPAMLLAMWAQWRVSSAYAAAQNVPASMTGAEAARHLLDSAGLRDVAIEEVPGKLTDHYDPREKVLRLSTDVYRRNSLASVGIAAHEAGHALQDAERYAPLVLRNLAVPMANFGSGASIFFIMIGVMLHMFALVITGIVLFSAAVVFQVVNLPVEFDASNRAKAHLVELGIVREDQMPYVRGVLNAAAWTYVAATLQAASQLLYYVLRFAGNSRDSR